MTYKIDQKKGYKKKYKCRNGEYPPICFLDGFPGPVVTGGQIIYCPGSEDHNKT